MGWREACAITPFPGIPADGEAPRTKVLSPREGETASSRLDGSSMMATGGGETEVAADGEDPIRDTTVTTIPVRKTHSTTSVRNGITRVPRGAVGIRAGRRRHGHQDDRCGIVEIEIRLPCGVGQEFIGGVDALKALLTLKIVGVPIRVNSHRQEAKPGFHLLHRRPGHQAQDGIRVDHIHPSLPLSICCQSGYARSSRHGYAHIYCTLSHTKPRSPRRATACYFWDSIQKDRQGRIGRDCLRRCISSCAIVSRLSEDKASFWPRLSVRGTRSMTHSVPRV